MERERWEGSVAYQRNGTSIEGTLVIQRIKSFRNLVTIDGLGQGDVKFERDGTFKGSWAMGNRIFNVNGKASGSQTYWEGPFFIREVDGDLVVTGSFRAKKTHD